MRHDADASVVERVAWGEAGSMRRVRRRGRKGRLLGVTAVAVSLGFGVAGQAAATAPLGAVPSQSRASATSTIVVAPSGSSADTRAAVATGEYATTSVAKAAKLAQKLAQTSDVVVRLSTGTYRLNAPLRFSSPDGGHQVTWEAAPGAHPVLSGAEQVKDWTLQNASANIWAAYVGKGVETRELYVNGSEAPRASIEVSRSDFTVTPTGLTITNPSFDYLAALPYQNQIELESVEAYKDRYSPVASISGTSILMAQPNWDNSTWGYDTIQSPNNAGPWHLENSYSFLTTAGQWYLNSATGVLYYKAAAGQDMSGLDVELPRLQSLVDISGTYTDPVSNLTFRGIEFSGTSWLGPDSDNGYADEQNGAHIVGSYTEPSDAFTSCTGGCSLFEATRNQWVQIPAAVQVSAAQDITFADDNFSELGQVGLGIGNDDDATASGVGLGASHITVRDSTFEDDAANGIVVGGVQPNAHHPAVPQMTNKDITIEDNLVQGVATDYKDCSAILSTYVTHAVIAHNQVDDLPYDGIDIGWGWGINDPGGSPDYVQRGTYNYQPIYTTPTTAKDDLVTHNLIFDTKYATSDGGSIYNLSASPGTVISDNYMYNNNETTALYLDEGSRYLTVTNNVVQGAGTWAFTNANPLNNTDDNLFADNYYDGGATDVATGPPHNNVLQDNVLVPDDNWPPAALQIIAKAGIQK